FASAEATRGAAQELSRPLVVTELGHRNAAQGETRRVVAQRDALERAERITGRQQARRRGEEGVHGGRIMGRAFGGSLDISYVLDASGGEFMYPRQMYFMFARLVVVRLSVSEDSRLEAQEFDNDFAFFIPVPEFAARGIFAPVPVV